MNQLIDQFYKRISKKILQYGEKYIKDEGNVIAIEIDYIIHQEFEKLREKLEKKK